MNSVWKTQFKKIQLVTAYKSKQYSTKLSPAYMHNAIQRTALADAAQSSNKPHFADLSEHRVLSDQHDTIIGKIMQSVLISALTAFCLPSYPNSICKLFILCQLSCVIFPFQTRSKEGSQFWFLWCKCEVSVRRWDCGTGRGHCCSVTCLWGAVDERNPLRLCLWLTCVACFSLKYRENIHIILYDGQRPH